MNSQVFLSRFTPSLMTPDVLERIFVQRGDLAEHLVEIVRESVLTPSKHHTLVLGPRGIGKTHLLSLVQHRVAKQEDLQDRMRIAWLREEEWGVSSFLDLLHRILRTLAETYKDEDLHAQTEKLFSLSTRTAERRAGDLLRSFLNGRALVLMTENLDDMFAGLGKKEQHRFRAYLQEEESWTVVATAQGLFAGVSLHESPFYGFFEVHHLQELSVDDAARLVMNIAKLHNDEELATFVQSPEGRSRIRAIHHLAGGNHRVYVILSEFLTRETLDDLVDPFLKAMDDLTPYYQSRMAQLSPQQRKIIDFLCDTRGAVPVKQIAQRCFMTPQTASSQLKDLRDRGYVRSTPIGRDSYYELSEPLMRIALEVKKQREGPVRLFLDFLRYWYSRDELVERLAYVQPHSALERDYLRLALEEHTNRSDDASVSVPSRMIVQIFASADPNQALRLAEQLVELQSDATTWGLFGWCLLRSGRPEEALSAADRALSAGGAGAFPWAVKSMGLAALSQYGKALEAFECGISVSENDEMKARLYAFWGKALRLMGRHEEAVRWYDQSVRTHQSCEPSAQLCSELNEVYRERGQVLLLLGDYTQAAGAYEQLIGTSAMTAVDWGNHAHALAGLGRYEDALNSLDRQLAGDPESVVALYNRGVVLSEVKRYEDAVDAFNSAAALPNADADVWLALGASYNFLHDFSQALDAFRTAFQKDPEGTEPRLRLVQQLLALGHFSEALPILGNPDLSDPNQHRLAFMKVWADCGLDQSEDARAILDSLLRSGSPAAADHAMIAPLVMQMSRHPGGENAQRGWISLLMESFTTHGAANQLAAGLVRAIPVCIPPMLSHDLARQWLLQWRAAAGSHPEFDMPLRLLHAAIEYRESGDERVLLSLPAEERRILEEVLESAAPPEQMQKNAAATTRAKKAGRQRKR